VKLAEGVFQEGAFQVVCTGGSVTRARKRVDKI
jgi:hypothetical protein